MEVAALWIALVSAFGTGAAGIIAWFARADALSAQTSAEKAQTAAVDAWQRAAGALERANELQVSLTSESIARDRRRARSGIGEPLRRWYTEQAMRVAMGQEPSTADRREKRDLSVRLAATGEPGAAALAMELELATRTVERADIMSTMRASETFMRLVREWIDDPDAFFETRRESFDPDVIRGDLDDVVRLFNVATDADLT